MRVRLSSGIERAAAFTLLEVVLAVAIAIGLLMVVLYFYSQAADLRARLLEETERISSIRLIMDRLTADLRSAWSDPAGTASQFQGSSTSLEFVKAAPPSLAAWTGGQLGRAAFVETDLRRVRCSLEVMTDETDWLGGGLVWTEEPAVASRRSALAARLETSPAPDEAAPPPPEPLCESIGYLRFRYWDGSSWAESWSGGSLPRAVEVTIAREAPPEEEEPGQDSVEIFRRVIYLPGSGEEPADTSLPAFDEFALSPGGSRP